MRWKGAGIMDTEDLTFFHGDDSNNTLGTAFLVSINDLH
jgi:hypothetical protein